MGAGSSTTNLRRVVNEEYNRLKKNGKEYLCLPELLELKVPASQWTINFSHLATLYVLDRSKSGRVTHADLIAFLEMAHDRSRGVPPGEFPSHMHGYCTLQLLRAAASAPKKAQLLDWTGHLVREGGAVQSKSKYQGKTFVTQEGLRPLFELLDLRDTQGLAFEDFWDLLQRLGEDQGTLPLDDSDLDGLVPIEVVRSFLDQMLDSMVRSIATILPLADIG